MQHERRNLRKSGEDHPAAKLTEEIVRQIRLEAAIPGTSQQWLARKYGISASAVRAVVARQTWKEVE